MISMRWSRMPLRRRIEPWVFAFNSKMRTDAASRRSHCGFTSHKARDLCPSRPRPRIRRSEVARELVSRRFPGACAAVFYQLCSSCEEKHMICHLFHASCCPSSSPRRQAALWFVSADPAGDVVAMPFAYDTRPGEVTRAKYSAPCGSRFTWVAIAQ